MGVLPAAGAPSAEGEGGSLFAGLLDADGGVPFPLARLLERIRSTLEPAGEFGGMPLVLIPLGRSLQRHAAGDADYFRFPRVVLAVTGEPANVAAPLFKDRLYLGYHEKAGVLEVISYNESAGRFEFEIVDDYRPGGSPRLRSGEREMCLACHQNGAPIFSRQSWDETSANPAMAALLALSGKEFYGLEWRRGVDVANAIDDATDRANLLAVAQRLWLEGCGTGGAGVRCRERLLWLALRSRLSGVPAADAEAADPVLAPLAVAWQTVWRAGLAIPNPDLPNRLPFAGLASEGLAALDAPGLRRLADVAARFDALALRPPLEVWHGGQPGVFGRLLQTLGEFIADVDLRALEAVLAQPAMAPTRSLALACERAVTAQRVELRCRGGDGAALSARLSAQHLRIDRLVLPAGEVRYGLDFQGRGANFRSRGPLLRSAAGEVLQAIEVADDSVSLHFVDDLAPLRLGLARMAEETLAGRSDALAAQPLRRAAVLTPLLAGFGIAGPRLPAVRPQPARVAVAAVAAEPVAADLLPFYRHCAACHDLPDAFPPGFLRGDAATVRARIDRCAPRMLQRLAMWAQPGGLRSKTPMPPPAAPQAAALRASPDGLAMRSWLEGRLAAQGLDPLAILRQPYADLPDCATYRGM